MGARSPSSRAWRSRIRSPRHALRKPRKPVFGNGVPRRRVIGELMCNGPDPRVFVERAHPDAERLRVRGIRRVQVAAALGAECLDPPASRWAPGPDLTLPSGDPERPGRGPGAERKGRSGPPLTALAVAVERLEQRRGDLEADMAACAAACKWGGQVGHAPYASPQRSGSYAHRANSRSARTIPQVPIKLPIAHAAPSSEVGVVSS